VKKINLLSILLFLFSVNIPIGALGNNGAMPTIIRPFGDSITFGYSGDFSATFSNCYSSQVWCFYPKVDIDGYFGGGYRGVLTWFAINEKSKIIKPFGTVGLQTGGSSIRQWLSMSQFHDGYPGARTDQMVPYSLMPTPLSPPMPMPMQIPTITLIHLGTNDILQGVDKKVDNNVIIDRAISNLLRIIKNILKYNNTQIYLAKIVMIPKISYTNNIVTDYNKAIDKNFSKLKNVTIVDMSDLLTAKHFSPDKVHPNLSGYFKMSCRWAIAANLFLSGKTCGDIKLNDLKTLLPLATVPLVL